MKFFTKRGVRRWRVRMAQLLSVLLTPAQQISLAGLKPIAGGASEPFEIILGGADIFFAPLGEPFPAVEDTPGGNWALIADAEHISEAGITIAGNIGTTLIRTLGSVAAVKAGIQTRDFNLEFEVLDVSAEAQALALGLDPSDNTTGVKQVNASGGNAGHRTL